MDEKLSDRVSYLIADSFGGSVRAAAGGIGVPQRTLANIASGDTSNPRADVLQAIADGFHTTTDWLLTGRGESPLKSQRQEAVYSSWNNLLRKLDLPADLEAHLREVPRAIERFDVLFAELSGWLPRRERPAMSVPDEQLRDYRKLAAAWTANVARKIEQNGIERVRAAFLHSAGRTMAVGVPSTAIANSSIATAPKTTPKRRKQ
jgi:transcriptional regulator with XRE-family HTH domain